MEAAKAEKRRKRAEARARAEAAGNQLHVQMFDVADDLDGILANLRPATGEPRFETKDLIFGPPQHAALGVEYYMCVDADSVRSGMTLGLQGIKDEVARNGTETDKECLQCTRI